MRTRKLISWIPDHCFLCHTNLKALSLPKRFGKDVPMKHGMNNRENMEKSRKETSLKCLWQLMYLQWIKGFYLWGLNWPWIKTLNKTGNLLITQRALWHIPFLISLVLAFYFLFTAPFFLSLHDLINLATLEWRKNKLRCRCGGTRKPLDNV